MTLIRNRQSTFSIQAVRYKLEKLDKWFFLTPFFPPFCNVELKWFCNAAKDAYQQSTLELTVKYEDELESKSLMISCWVSLGFMCRHVLSLYKSARIFSFSLPPMCTCTSLLFEVRTTCVLFKYNQILEKNLVLLPQTRAKQLSSLMLL